MTDRHAGYLITLDCDIREDDAEYLMSAIRMLRGVLTVTPVTSTAQLDIAELRRDAEWRRALMDLAREGPHDD